MPQQILAFGTFRFDRNSYTLYEANRLIPLTAKAARVLALLLDRSGEVVTKEEFLSVVWQGTFVEQRSLTQCIFLLRRALGDHDEEGYIETVAKRGYRFAAPVEWVDATAANPPEVAVAKHPESGPEPPGGVPVLSVRRVVWAAVPLLLAALAAFGWAWRRGSAPPPSATGPLVRLTWSGSASDPDVAPDGSFAVFAGEDPDDSTHAIYRQDLPSGFPRRITPPSEEPVESPAISGDGRQVAFRSSAGDGQILVVPADGSSAPVPVPDSSRGRQPRWQPGRSAITYWVASEEHIRDFGLVQLQQVTPARKPIRLFDGFDTAYSPLWAPDGSGLLSLGTQQSSMPDREFDAWVNPFRAGVSTTESVRTGLFDLLRARGLYSTVRDRARITVTAWHSGHFYVSIYGGHAANLYRVPVGADFRVYGEPQRLTSGTQILTSPRVSAKGRMLLTSMSLEESPWRLSLDGRSLERLPAGAGWLSRLSISSDARRIAAEVYAAGNPITVLLASFDHGPNRVAASGSVAFPVISGDGARVAWRVMDGRQQAIEVANAEGGTTGRICADCGAPEEWTADGAALLYHTGGAPARIGVVEVAARQPHDWIIHPDFGVFGPRLHSPPKGRPWVAFYAENSPRTRQIFIAPVNGWEPPPVSTWIPVTGGAQWDSSPVWSPDGLTVYFVSLRDGHRCIYSQRLHPATNRPVGDAQPVQHLHSAAHPLAGFNRARGAESLRVAAGHLYFVLDSVSSDIWSIQLR